MNGTSSRVGCGDNSCIFRVLWVSGGMATNGGCRCFKDLEQWNTGTGTSNRDSVRAVQQNTQRVVGELRRTQAELKKSQNELEVMKARLDKLEKERASLEGRRIKNE